MRTGDKLTLDRLIEDYNELIDNLLLGGLIHLSLDRELANRVLLISKKYKLDYGVELLEELSNLFHQEEYGMEKGKDEKTQVFLKLVAYIDYLKDDLKEIKIRKKLDIYNGGEDE